MAEKCVVICMCVVIYVWLYMCECDLVQIKNSFQQQFNGSLAEWIKVWLKIVWLLELKRLGKFDSRVVACINRRLTD